MKKLKRLTLLALVVALTACGGGYSSPTMSPTPSVAGTWDAAVTVTGGTESPVGTRFSAVLALAQSGSNVSGTFTTTTGSDGTVTGTVSGQVFTFTGTQTAPCAGSFSGTGTLGVYNTSMSGAYSGSDCGGTFQTTFTATKR